MGMEKVASEYDISKDDILQEMAGRTPLWIISWAYYNPDTTITVGHSFVDMSKYVNMTNLASQDFKFLPGFEHSEITFYESFARNFYAGYTFLENLYELYPSLDPSKDIEEWLNSGQMPKQLEKTLFTLQAHILGW